MPSKVSQSPRSRRNRLERIDIDELFDSPSNRGMLSFLERAPEEARARLEERRKVDSAEASLTSLPRAGDLSVVKSNSAPDAASRLGGDRAAAEDERTGRNLRGGDLLADNSPTVGDSPPKVASPSAGTAPTGEQPPPAYDSTPAPQVLHSLVNKGLSASSLHNRLEASTGVNLHPVRESRPEAIVGWPDESPSKVTLIEESPCGKDRSATPPNAAESPRNIPLQDPSLRGTPPAEGESPTVGAPPPPQNPSLFRGAPSGAITARSAYECLSLAASGTGVKSPTVIDGTIIGRRQKIRRAVVAQDGHSSGEQLLYQALWNAARPESGSLDRRIIVAGYQGMSALCKLDKKNCKKNAKGLIEKLALEVAETYRSDERIGTTYRIFSYKEVLRRREEAGMVWVVRTSGVRFVPLNDDDRQSGQGVTHPERDLGNAKPSFRNPVGNLPPGFCNSPPDPVGNWSMASLGDSPRHTVGESPLLLGINRKTQQKTSATFPPQLGPRLRALLPSLDDDAARQLWTRCSQIAPDCTEDDIEYCFQIKAHQLLRGRKKIDNPVGIMIWSVPKTFEGTDPLYLRRRLEIERIRKAEEEERQRSRATLREMLEDPRTSAEDKVTIRRLLEEQ